MHRISILAFLLLSAHLLLGQSPTPSADRIKGFEQRKTLQKNTFTAAFEPKNIGPSIFSCRVTDLDVNPADPTEMYVAYASGGLWHTTNNGTSFEPVFDHEASMTIGDIAVDWANKVIWVGTGECNSSRSSYAGTGMYRSTDGGKTWDWKGLPESHHISRVILHPTNPNVLWVAVLGHLYTTNPERGVYRTSDGGQTWQQTLFVDDKSGAIDLCLDPNNPNTVYAASWERERSAWDFKGAGEGSAIWKSTDGGLSFQKITTGKNGFPIGPKTGRIGLSAGLLNGKTVLYASLDNQNPSTKKKENASKDELTKDQFRTMKTTDFASLDDEKLTTFLKNNDFPDQYTAKKVKDMVAKGKITPLTLVDFLEDANSNLFETDFTGAEVYRSDDGGNNWYKTHTEPLEQINFTYGYYFSNIRCAPNDANQVYLMGYNIIRSEDGGKNWKKISQDNVHPDHHALWVHPTRPGHIVNGNDGGVNISWDNGASWILCNQPPVGQFYAIATDNAEPYNVYGGAQDNGVWVGPSTYTPSTGWHQDGQYPYRSLLGGDGMQVAVDTRDNTTVYTGYQFGNYYRLNRYTGTQTHITPKHDLGERPFRWNWQTPIHLSIHQRDVLYMGSNKLHRSFNKGNTWEALSQDLTGGGKVGNVPFGTLTAIHESPLKFGLLYTGSDDGLVHVSRDGGETWIRITDGLPADKWVARIQASAHVKSRVYITLNDYRKDNFAPMLFVSEDYGAHWSQLGNNLPLESLNVIREDPANPNLLFVGSDHGVYYSLDRGQTFHAISPDFPATPVHDLAIQAQAKDLVIGTHGRSMYTIHIGRLQEMTDDVLQKTLYVFDIAKKTQQKAWGKKIAWKELKDPELPIQFYSNAAGAATWKVVTKEGLLLQQGNIVATKGLNRLVYHLDVEEKHVKSYEKALKEAQKAKQPIELEKADTGKVYLQKGNYKWVIEQNGAVVEKDFIVD